MPELAHLDLPFIHEPYLMTPMEAMFYNFELGKDYPHPIVDIIVNRTLASDILWKMKKDPDVVKESFRILKRHTISDRNRMLNSN